MSDRGVEHSRCQIQWFPVICTFALVFLMGTTSSSVVAQSDRVRLAEAVNALRKLYQEVHPKLENVKIYRDSDRRKRVNEVKEDVRELVTSRLNEVKSLLDTIQSDNASLKRKVRQVRKTMSYFDRYRRKVLSNWKPNPQLLRAFNRNELIQRELASPDMLRKQFLADLTSMLHTQGYVREDVIGKQVHSYAARVQKTYRTVLEKFLGLLNEIDRARNSKAKEVEAVKRRAAREWRTFWNELKEERTNLQEDVNRLLSLYRGREHLPAIQKFMLKKGMRIKREFGDLMEFQPSRSGTNPFSNRKQLRVLLILMAKKYVQRLVSLLNNNREPFLYVFRSLKKSRPEFEQVDSKKAYGNLRSKLDGWLEDTLSGKYDFDASLELIRNVPVEQLSSLVRRLTSHYGTNEKKLGTVLDELRTYSTEFVKFAERVRQVQEEFAGRFRQVSFESKEQFRKEFPGSDLEEKMNALERTKQRMERRLSSLKNKSTEVLQLDFQVRDGAGEAG